MKHIKLFEDIDNQMIEDKLRECFYELEDQGYVIEIFQQLTNGITFYIVHISRPQTFKLTPIVKDTIRFAISYIKDTASLEPYTRGWSYGCGFKRASSIYNMNALESFFDKVEQTVSLYRDDGISAFIIRFEDTGRQGWIRRG